MIVDYAVGFTGASIVYDLCLRVVLNLYLALGRRCPYTCMNMVCMACPILSHWPAMRARAILHGLQLTMCEILWIRRALEIHFAPNEEPELRINMQAIPVKFDHQLLKGMFEIALETPKIRNRLFDQIRFQDGLDPQKKPAYPEYVYKRGAESTKLFKDFPAIRTVVFVTHRLGSDKHFTLLHRVLARYPMLEFNLTDWFIAYNILARSIYCKLPFEQVTQITYESITGVDLRHFTGKDPRAPGNLLSPESQEDWCSMCFPNHSITRLNLSGTHSIDSGWISSFIGHPRMRELDIFGSVRELRHLKTAQSPLKVTIHLEQFQTLNARTVSYLFHPETLGLPPGSLILLQMETCNRLYILPDYPVFNN